jgi:mannose-6-phosphate isomerase-like protein (cupin superfamily)
MDVPEAQLEQTEHGLVYKGDGWFVVNAEDVRWRESEGAGRGTNWESDEEDFLVLSGTATLIVEGRERPLRRWDFVHCPPHTEHTIVGGPEGCVVLGVGSRERHTEVGPDGERRGKEGESAYTVDETAIRYGAGIEPGTPQDQAYSRFPPRRFVRYGGWLEQEGSSP